MSVGRCCVALTALLAMAGCALPQEYAQPAIYYPGQPTRLYGVMPPAAAPPPPARPIPLLPPPRSAYDQPSYLPKPEPEPPFSDGTPFSLETPLAPEPDPILPSYAEPAAPPPVRAAAPAPAVPMVGFRPMRPLNGRSY